MTSHAPCARTSRNRGAPAIARRAGVALGVVAVTAALGPAAHAQFGEAAGFSEIMSAYYLRRDLNLFAERLGLDEPQNAIIENLYFDYEDAHEAARLRMLERISGLRDKMTELREDRDRIMELVFEPFEAQAQEWEDLRERFLVDVQAVLNRQQLDAWDSFRRELRREKELPKGRLSGESINLFHLLNDRALGLSTGEQRQLQAVMDEYEMQLDAALRRREQLTSESRLVMMKSMRADDNATSLRIFDDQVETRVAIRDTNDRFTTIIADALSGDLGQRFAAMARERAYPRIFRATAAERLFTEAKEIEGLVPDVLAAVEDLERAFLTEIAEVNGSLVRLLRDYEPEEMRYKASSFAMRQSGERPSKPRDPTREEFRRRDEIGRGYVEQLRGLLTPEQFASLPGAQRFLRQHEGNRAEDDVVEVGGRKIGRKLLPNQGRSPGLSRDDE